MKNIIRNTIIACFSVFLLSSCDKTEEVIYEGPALLQFSGESGKKTVELGQVTAEALIPFGTHTPVSVASEVKLIFDAAKSTAVPGVDFTLVNGGVEVLNAGQSYGNFKVNILESGATPVPKIAVFHLSSEALQFAPASGAFAQEFTLTMSLRCSVNYFLGSGGFNYDGDQYDPGQYLIEKVPNKPNTLRIVDFLSIGIPFVFTYDDDGVISFKEQVTGTFYQNSPITVSMPAGTAGDVGPSTMDECARKAVINMRFSIKALNLTFGNHAETFTGF